MNKKNLIILMVISVVTVLVASLAIIIPAAVKNSRGNSGENSTAGPSGTPSPGTSETPEPSREEIFAERFGDFPEITVTIGADPKTTANITWLSLTRGLSGYVRYYEKSAGRETAVTVAAEAHNEVFSVPVYGEYDFKSPRLEDVKGDIHRCYLTGLKPGTEYCFTAGYGDGAESAEKTFKTAADSDSFTFVTVSDTQGFTKRNFDVWENLANLAAAKYPEFDFMIHLGDAVEEGKNIYQWKLYFDAAESLVSGKPVIDVAGNRDKKHTLLHYTNGPREDRTPLAAGYYSFDWGNVHFVVLNTGDGEKDLPKSQLTWLKEDLALSEGKTKIILMHKAPYSNANHFSDPEIVAMRAQILPVAEEYGVTAVLSGHDHYYFRSKPVDGEGKEAVSEVETVNIAGNDVEMIRSAGTVYFVSSSAGVKQHDDPIPEGTGIAAAKAALMKGPSFSYVTVDGEKIVFLTYVLENGELKLFDSFGIYLN